MIAPSGDSRFVARVASHADPLANDARVVEAAVFGEWFGNDVEELAREYDRYASATLWLILIDRESRAIAGTMRLIRGGTIGLKTLDDMRASPIWGANADRSFRESGLDPRATIDIATLAVAPRFRASTSGLPAALALYAGLCRLTDQLGARFWTAVFDLRVLKLFEALGRPFRPFPVRPDGYLGSPASVPAWCDFLGLKRRLRASLPGLNDLMFRDKSLVTLHATSADQTRLDRASHIGDSASRRGLATTGFGQAQEPARDC